MIIAVSGNRSRKGFTLLEVLLASVIATFVLAALYVFLEVSLRQASEGREVVERATLARGIINRIHNDLTPSITPPCATSTQKATNSSSQSSSTTATNTTGTTSTSGSTSASASTTSSTTTETDETTTTTAVSLQAGVIGDANVLTIYTTRVPDPRQFATVGDGTDSSVPSDIRRITYWLGANGGLCRQEIPWVTGDNVYNISGTQIVEPDKSEKDYLIAREVSSLSFEYYDINASTDDAGWLETWDGSELGADGLTPIGPPTAIRVSFSIKFKNQRGEETTKSYRHVIPIITASGPDSTEQQTSPEASDTTTTSSP